VKTITLPDGRRLGATYEGDPVGWVGHVVGDEDRPVAGRDLAKVLVDLLTVTARPYPPWLRDAVDQLSGRDTPLGRRFACPCCGFLTLDEAPTGTFAICKVCFWEDDNIQFGDPDYRGGANRVSLNQARENYLVHAAAEPRVQAHVRSPLHGEQP
jgi:hypothetical protein